MSGYELSKADRQRLVNGIVGQLEDFPRQHAALESAMAEFGEDFDLGPFKDAFDSVEDLTAYNRAQAVERAVGRVQNLLTDLAMSGARLAELPVKPSAKDDSRAKPFFDALRDVEVIDAELSRRLEKGQKARSRLEHDYLRMPAGDVHRATRLVHETARDFIGPYRAWIEPYLN